MTCKTELEELFKQYEEVVERGDEKAKGTSAEDCFNENKKCKFVIYCEFVPDNAKPLHLHYECKGGGSEQFNEIINKYNLELEWENCCVALLFEN